MPDADETPINPFLTAKRESGVYVLLEVRDVLSLRPAWTYERAATFIDRHAPVVASAMLTAGTEVFARLLEEEP